MRSLTDQHVESALVRQPWPRFRVVEEKVRAWSGKTTRLDSPGCKLTLAKSFISFGGRATLLLPSAIGGMQERAH
jgi:hypothetical protein